METQQQAWIAIGVIAIIAAIVAITITSGHVERAEPQYAKVGPCITAEPKIKCEDGRTWMLAGAPAQEIQIEESNSGNTLEVYLDLSEKWDPMNACVREFNISGKWDAIKIYISDTKSKRIPLWEINAANCHVRHPQ